MREYCHNTMKLHSCFSLLLCITYIETRGIAFVVKQKVCARSYNCTIFIEKLRLLSSSPHVCWCFLFKCSFVRDTK
jgi:hypothetical protein